MFRTHDYDFRLASLSPSSTITRGISKEGSTVEGCAHVSGGDRCVLLERRGYFSYGEARGVVDDQQTHAKNYRAGRGTNKQPREELSNRTPTRRYNQFWFLSATTELLPMSVGVSTWATTWVPRG